MKKIFVLLFFTFISLQNVRGQCKFDICTGYGYSFLNGSEKYVYEFSEIKAYSFQLQLGIEKKVSNFYSNNFGISYINRWIQNTTKYPYSNEAPTETLTQNYFGSNRIYFMNKFYPFKKVRLSFNIGAAFDRLHYTRLRNGETQTIEKNQSIFKNLDYIGIIGFTYDFPISSKINFYIQPTLSRSIIYLNSSYYDPLNGILEGNTDLQINLGMTYNLKNNYFSKEERSIRNVSYPTKTKYIRDFEIKTFVLSGMRNLNTSKNEPEPLSYGPYGSTNASINSSNNKFKGYGVGSSFSINRIYTTIEVNWEHYSNNITSYVTTSFSHPHLPFGSIDNYQKEIEYFDYTMTRVGYMLGFGVKIFHPKSRINLIPLLKFSSSYTKALDIQKNYITEEYVYYWDSSPFPENNVHWDSTHTPSRYYINKHNFDILFGCKLSVALFYNFHLNVDVMYSLSNSPILGTRSYRHSDVLKFYNSIGIGYQIPMKLKDKLKYRRAKVEET